MKTLIIALTLSISFTTSASYTLSIKDIRTATKNIKSYYDGASIKYAGKKTLVVTVNNNVCVIKNVTFFKDYKGVKMIDEKTYNKLEACTEGEDKNDDGKSDDGRYES